MNHKGSNRAGILILVEMARIELASKSISGKLSPSTAVIQISHVTRLIGGLATNYPVSPLRYREITQGFPV